MRTFYMHPLVAAIIMAVLVMGGLGAFVIVPILCLNWAWNSLVVQVAPVPEIVAWQAALLYCACVCFAFLLGFIEIDFKAETGD